MSTSGSKTPLKSIGARDITKLEYEKSGHLRKEGLIERSLLGQFFQWRQYFVVLRDGCCYVFENDQSTQPKTAFSFENYCRIECFSKPPDYDYCFKLIPRAGCEDFKEHCFAASDDSGRQEWLIAIYKALHVANNLPEPIEVGKQAWTEDIFRRSGERRSERKGSDRGESHQQKRYSQMPTGKTPLSRSKSYPLPPVPKPPAYEYDEIMADSDSDVPTEDYDDCHVQRKPAPNPKPNIAATKQHRPAPPLPPSENSVNTAPQGSYINLDLNQKIDDLPLFKGDSSEAKRAIKDQSVGTFLIRTSSQADSKTLYVLVVSAPTEELQFRIFKQVSGKIYITEGVYFTCLSELVDHYRKNDLSATSKMRLAKQYGHMDN